MLSPRTSSRAMAGVGAVLALALTACSSGSSSPSAAATSASSAAAAAPTSAPAAAAPTSAKASSAGAGATSSAPTAAASAAPSSAASAAPTSAAANTAKTQLTFWSWVPNIAKVVALWNSSHPDIHVTVNTQAQGAALYTKLTTADKAGNPPDVFQAEYQELPTLVSSGTAADISKLIAPIKSKFTAGTWGLTTFGGAQYGIPQDTGPMMLFYRADLFKQYGLAVPTTWDQYASEAKTVHAAHPGVYMGSFSSSDPGWFAGLAQQAKSQWWSTSGDTWTVGINDAASQKVATYWGDLVNAGVIDKTPFFTPQWNAELAKGTLLTWPSAVWAPGVLSGSAPKSQGDWVEAPLPAWTAGDTHVGFWGGSSTAVAAKSKNQAAAVQFASWLNTDPTAVEALVTQGALYPASIPGQATPALTKAPAFLSNEPDYYKNAATISTNAGAFTFGPDVNLTYSTYNDAFGKAIQNKSSFVDALNTMQTATVADMKKAGFKTTG